MKLFQISFVREVTKIWLSAKATRCRNWSGLVTAFARKYAGIPPWLPVIAL